VRIYHGSYTAIENIDLSKSKANKDFGRGFYVTKFREQAERWARRTGDDHNTNGVISEFDFDEFAWEDDELQTLRFDTYDEAWLDFVVLNRSGNRQPKHNYDIIEGPVADDAVVTRMVDYIDGMVSKQNFLKELSFFKQTHQICFCSVKSLLSLKGLNRKPLYNLKHITTPLLAALINDNKIDEEKAADIFYSSKTFTRLANNSTNLHQKSWQKIYEMLKNETISLSNRKS
jgi:hypothetical protein